MELKIFEKEDFGTLRTLTVDNEVFFCLSDLSTILNIKSQTCPVWNEATTFQIEDSFGNVQDVKFIDAFQLRKLVLHYKGVLFSCPVYQWISDVIIPACIND